jgi:hypothetical protein
MRRSLQVFVILAGKPAGTPPEPGPKLDVDAPTYDGLLDAAREALVARDYRIRVLSFTPTGLVAYVEAAP